MKIILTFIAAVILSANAIADNPKKDTDSYCAKLKDGIIVIMYQGNPITAEVTLSNGIKIEPDGTLIKNDGTKQMLKDGECISKNGSSVTVKDKKNKSTELK